jgi:hypothetical protein
VASAVKRYPSRATKASRPLDGRRAGALCPTRVDRGPLTARLARAALLAQPASGAFVHHRLGSGADPRAHPFARGEQGTVALLFAGASFSRHIFGARPASPPPGLTMGPRLVRVTRVSSVGARAFARRRVGDARSALVELTSRVRNPPHVALVARPRWRSLHRNAPTSDVSIVVAGHRRIDSESIARFRSARLSAHGSVHPPTRIAISWAPLGAHARTIRDAFVVSDHRTLATRMAPKPPSPPADAFEGNDACACRSSNERWPRMTNIPLLRTVLTRSPSEGRVILRRASGSSEPGHAIRAVSFDSDPDVRPRCVRPTSATQTNQRRAPTSRVLPASTPRLSPRACPTGLGPFDGLRARARRQHREAWGRSMQQGRGTVRFTTRGFASADRAGLRGASSAPTRTARSSL